MKKLVYIIFGFFLAISLSAEARNALLIANENYTNNFAALNTPVRDARELKEALEQLDFNVYLIINANIDEMDNAVNVFSRILKEQGGIGLFHYGGHAIEINGKNYLIPINKDIESEQQAERYALLADDVTKNMFAETNIVILDSCRTIFRQSFTRGYANRGLKLIDNIYIQKNTIVVYSVQSGSEAIDGLYTPILTQKLLEKKEFRRILQEVKTEVFEQSGKRQIPTDNDDLFIYDLYLAGEPDSPAEDHISFSDDIRSYVPSEAYENGIPSNLEISMGYDPLPDDEKNPYSFGLYLAGNIIDMRYEGLNGSNHYLNGISVYVMWAEFNKNLFDGSLPFMFGSSYSYYGKGLCDTDYGFSYHDFEIGSAYIGYNVGFMCVYMGVGLGLGWTNHEYRYGSNISNIQNSSSCYFLLSLHPIIEFNLTNYFKIRVNWMDWDFTSNGHRGMSWKLGCGISL